MFSLLTFSVLGTALTVGSAAMLAQGDVWLSILDGGLAIVNFAIALKKAA